MSNGNPVGSAKVAAAQKRLDREQAKLKTVQVFTPDSSRASELLGVQVENGVVKSLSAALKVHADHPGLFNFLVDGAETTATFVTDTLAVISACKKTIKRFGG